jgi:hypothetical protein
MMPFKGVSILHNHDIDYLDPILVDEATGLLKVVDSAILREINPEHLVVWGNKRGVYTYPTTELIAWIKEKIGGRSAIEICSGNGVIGRALGIVRTDSYIQVQPEMIALYESMGQKPIAPPNDVYRFESNDAVDYFKPQVVVGCYATQKYLPGDERPPKVGSSVYGVDELAMLPKIETYINVGTDTSHGDKRIRKFKHEIYRFDWLFTRSANQKENHICVWNAPYEN